VLSCGELAATLNFSARTFRLKGRNATGQFNPGYLQRLARPLPQPSKTSPSRNMLAGSGVTIGGEYVRNSCITYPGAGVTTDHPEPIAEFGSSGVPASCAAQRKSRATSDAKVEPLLLIAFVS
jgi:hypothetical protein